jgi:hypothetical protein
MTGPNAGSVLVVVLLRSLSYALDLINMLTLVCPVEIQREQTLVVISPSGTIYTNASFSVLKRWNFAYG